MLQPSDLHENKIRAERRLLQLTAPGATKCKSGCLGGISDGENDTDDEMRFIIVSLHVLNELMKFTQCKDSSGDVTIINGECEYVLTMKLFLICVDCGEVLAA